MIRFITGKPGAGKGIVTCQQVIEELRNGDRPIIAYFAFKFDPWVRMFKKNGKLHAKPEIGLSAYLKKEYGSDFNVRERLHLLDEDQAAEFYLYRVIDGKLVKADCERENGKVIKFDHELAKKSGGCLYVLDEAQKFYASRNFMKTGEAFLSYCSLHRHFADDVLVCTQHTKLVDVACSRVAQDFWVVKNHGKLKVGIFRQPDLFTVKVYDQPPTGAAIEALETKYFRLDKAGIGGCYDTAGGLRSGGAVGSAGDLFERKQGIPWYFAIVGIALAGFCIYKGSFLIGAIGGHVYKKTIPVASKSETAGRTNAPSHPVDRPDRGMRTKLEITNDVPPAAPFNSDAQTLNSEFDTSNEVFCVGYTVLHGEATVFLSDGTTIESSDHDLQRVGHHQVWVLGRKFPILPAQQPPDYQNVQTYQPPYPAENPSYSQSLARPVNQAIILPSIRNHFDDLQRPNKLNGFSSMGRNSQTPMPVAPPAQNLPPE